MPGSTIKSSTIAERLRQVRDEEKLSQRDFAKKLDISLSALQAYESAKSVPGSHVLEQVCTMWPINGHWLLTGNEPRRLDDDARMLLGSRNDGKTLPEHISAALSIIEALGLTDLAVLSARRKYGQSYPVQFEVHGVLAQHKEGLYLEELFEKVSDKIRAHGIWQFRQELKPLIWAGTITQTETEDGILFKPKEAEYFMLRAQGTHDIGELIWEVVERTVKHVWPAVLKESPTGTVRRFRATVASREDGTSLVRECQKLIRDRLKERSALGQEGEHVVIMLMGYVEEDDGL